MSETVEAPARVTLGNYVGGEWRGARSGETYEKRNPMRPDEVVADVPACDADDVDDAVAAAREAFPGWAATPAPQRGNLLVKAAEVVDTRVEEIASEMTREMGKPLREARMEAARAATILRFFGGEGYRPLGELSQQTMTGGPVYTMRRPLGVVGLITPWNFPAAIPAWKLAPALAYGNAVVLKLATDAPVTGLHLAECLAEAGLPPGVLNVLTGSGSKVGNAIVRDPRVRAISFTGSVPVGQSVRDEATKLGKRVQLELGGHNPLIVLADAKMDAAVEAAYAGAFWSAGQKCTATRRIYVQDPVYDDFKRRLLARIDRAAVGDPTDPATEVGPIVNEKQFDEIVAAIERGRSEGGEVIAGGGRADETGYVIEPTVFEGVRDDAFLSCEEVFGPVTSLYRIGDLDEGLRRANAVEFGLSAAIFTQNLEAAQRFANEAEAGLLHVNSQTAGAEVHVPFGGIKASGFGPHEQGRAALEFYTEVVTVYQDV
ncbi:MAG: aldehyde dehydrogenase family protein [Actinobacteria bacterium]|nr:MAG: aldehyde dehydrogenase family protein [Actinomycetota bacterium]